MDIWNTIAEYITDEDKKKELETILLKEINSHTSDTKDVVDLGFKNTGQLIPSIKLDEKNEEIKSLNNQISDSNKQLEELKKSAGINEETKLEIEKLQTENKTMTETNKKEKIDLILKYNLVQKLTNAKVLMPEVIASQILLDSDLRNQLQVNETTNEVNGVDVLLNQLKDNSKYKDAFKEIVETGEKGNNPDVIKKADVDENKSGLGALQKEIKEALKNKDVASVSRLQNEIDMININQEK